MRLDSFSFSSRHLAKAHRAETLPDVVQLIGRSLKADGRIGETGWTVTVSTQDQAWDFILVHDGTQIVKAFLAGTNTVSAKAWERACAEAAALGRLPPGSAPLKPDAPWLSSVTLGDIHTVSKSVRTEAVTVQLYVAVALLDTLALDGELQ